MKEPRLSLTIRLSGLTGAYAEFAQLPDLADRTLPEVKAWVLAQYARILRDAEWGAAP